MRRDLRAGVGLLLLVAVTLAWADNDDTTDKPVDTGSETRVQIVAGAVRLTLPAAQQQDLGLQLASATAHHYIPEVEALGVVADTNELLQQRETYRQQQSKRAGLERQALAQQEFIQRLQTMRNQGALVAVEQLHQSQQDLLRLQSEIAAAESTANATALAVLSAWGEPLAAALKQPSPSLLDELARQREYLVSAGLGVGQRWPGGLSEVWIEPAGERRAAVQARALAKAARGDALLGETYLFLATGEGLRAGMKVSVWAADSSHARDGVRVAKSALIWHSGKQWVYVRHGSDQFERRAVVPAANLDTEVFVADALKPQDEVVVVGAESLLAEEFRWSIPREDED